MAADTRLLDMLNIISACFYNSRSENPDVTLNEELKGLLGDIKINSSGAINTEEAAVEGLKFTAEWMLNDTSIKFTKDVITSRVKLHVIGENDYVGLITDGLDDAIPADECNNRVIQIISGLRHSAGVRELREVIKRANLDINFNAGEVDIEGFVKDLQDKLESSASSGEEIIGRTSRVSFSDVESMKTLLNETADLNSKAGLLSTGFQGLDRMFGGGLNRGGYFNVGACTHNYKSGLLIDLALFIPVFNKPKMLDPRKKPLILRISFENTLKQDIWIMYKKLYQLKHGKSPDAADLSGEEVDDAKLTEAANLLKDHFTATGYTFELEQLDPTKFTPFEMFKLFQTYEKMGYEIHAVSCDYATLFSHNVRGERMDTKIENTAEIIRNYCNPRGITFLTAHQLSSEALTLSREKPSNFTKVVCEGGWYKEGKSYHTKLDAEILLHKVPHIDGREYITASRGKHRGGEETPLSHRHYVQPFEEFGGLIPDVGGEPRFLDKLPSAIDEAVGDDGNGSWD